jgi:hypothetical protein
MSTLPIGDYALLSDCRSAALVGRDGSVDWLCFRRFDGPSVFARLLDDDAGHLSVRPAGEFAATRRYLDQTMALATTFTTATGVAVLTDALAVGRNDRGHALGAGSPGVLVLSAPVAPAVDGATASARFTLRAGESAGFALAYASSGAPRDFLYSKLMCWVALDRAIALAGPPGRRRSGRGLDRHPGGDPHRHLRARLERAGRRLHPGLRRRRPGRQQPDAGHHRVPARRRPADEGHHRRHRRTAR